MTTPPVLCKNYSINFQSVSSAHKCFGTIWRIAAIVFAVAAAILLLLLILSRFGGTLALLDAVLLLGSFGGIAGVAFHLMWKGGSTEYAQSDFYARVQERFTYLKTNWGLPEIEEFFGDHQIELPTEAAVIELLREKVDETQDPLLAFLPSIAHYEILMQDIKPLQAGPEFLVDNAKRGLHEMNAAMLLQTMHRPTENISMKLDELAIDTINGVGHYDLIGVIADKKPHAFIFETKKNDPEKPPLTTAQFDNLEPKELRALIFAPPAPEANPAPPRSPPLDPGIQAHPTPDALQTP
jgi:hypothetical protein